MASKRRGKEAKPQSPPKAAEVRAAKKADEIFAAAKAKAEKTIAKLLKANGAPADAIKRLRTDLSAVTNQAELESWAHAHIKALDSFNFRQSQEQLSVQIDLKVTPKQRDQLVRLCVATMSKIPLDVAKSVSPIVQRALTQGLRGEEIAGELRGKFKGTAREARRAAVGSVIRANSALTEIRHTKAGITEYTWRASPDRHTRKWHRDLNGTRQRYADPPIGGGGGPKDRGNPGSADVCRCQAIPIIPDD
jgi:SPP1 gp7 family putative phage head morphogenesis protein